MNDSNGYGEFIEVEATPEQRSKAELRELVQAGKVAEALAVANKMLAEKGVVRETIKELQKREVIELLDAHGELDLPTLVELLEIEETYHRPAPTWRDFRQNTPKEIAYFIEGLIMKNARCYLAADSKFGKSLLTMYLAMCAASGEPFFGREVESCPVIMIDKENDLVLNRWRSDAIGRGLGLSPRENDDLPIMPLFRDSTTLADPRSVDWLKKQVSDFKPGLITVDTLIRCTRGLGENIADDMNEVAEVMAELRRDTSQDFVFLFLHHTNRDKDATGQNRVRGSGDITAMVDHGFLIDKVIEANGAEKFGLTEVSARHGTGNEIKYRMMFNKTERGDMVQFIETTQNEGETDGALDPEGIV